jgi:hypothetical protein
MASAFSACHRRARSAVTAASNAPSAMAETFSSKALASANSSAFRVTFARAFPTSRLHRVCIEDTHPLTLHNPDCAPPAHGAISPPMPRGLGIIRITVPAL